MVQLEKAIIASLVALLCGNSLAQEERPNDPLGSDPQAVAIQNLIEELVFQHARAGEVPLIAPGVDEDDDAYRRQFEKCEKAFQRLTEYKEAAFPFLVAHLADDRPSIPFRNHYLGHSVGKACYWNIYYQLQDRPDDYSSYGYSRKGSDGQDHPKPYWEGTPFDEAGGLKAWLEQNKELSYAQKQIKCLSWLLAREKAIGAPDAQSYLENILPLETRILERKREAGENIDAELEHLRTVLNEMGITKVPAGLLAEASSLSKPTAIACVVGGAMLVIAIWIKRRRAPDVTKS